MKIEKIWLTPTVVWIRTEDGREACELFDDYPRLNDASVEQLCDYDYDEFGIHWNAMDEDLSLEGFFDKQEPTCNKQINLDSFLIIVSALAVLTLQYKYTKHFSMLFFFNKLSCFKFTL